MPVKQFVAFDKLLAGEMNSLLLTKSTHNYIYNSSFEIAQRGTSVSLTTTGAYTLDRWYCTNSVTAATVTQETTIVPTASRYALKMAAGGTTIMSAAQYLETADVISLAGSVVSLSAQVVSSGPTSNITMTLQYSTTTDAGTGATWVTVDTATQALTTSFALISLEAESIPSTARSLRVTFANVTAFTTGQSWSIGNVQLEQGSFVSPYDRMADSIADELAICQRYFVRLPIGTLATTAAFIGRATSTSAVEVVIPLPTQMRLNTSGVVTMTSTTIVPSVGTITSNPTVFTTLAASARVVLSVTGVTANTIVGFSTTANIDFSCEII
jgi:hypothetical protein